MRVLVSLGLGFIVVAASLTGGCDKKDAKPVASGPPEAVKAASDEKAADEKADKKAAKPKPGSAKPTDDKAAKAKQGSAKPVDAKVKPGDAKAAGAKAGDAKAAGAKPGDDAPRVVDFPDVPLQAKVGQWVFAPTRKSLEETKGNPKYRSPRYMQFQVVEVGPAVSKVSPGYGKPVEIPNAYMIPLPPKEPVAAGDVVLGARYGNNMELAIVTEGGDAPKADFVEEMPYTKDNVAPLKPGRFVKLDGTLRPGAAVALKTGPKSYSFAFVMNMAGDKLFLAGFMGKALVATKADVVPLELTPKLAVGDVVSARWSSGGFKKAQVKSIDAKARLVGLKWLNFPDDKIAMIPPVHVTKKLKLE